MKYVDISEYCTDKWISRGGELPNGIEEVILDEKYLIEGKIKRNGFSFMPPSEGNDIMLCNGQTVEVKESIVTEFIDFAGFAVYGVFREDFVFHWADGSNETVKMSYADVLCHTPKLMAEDNAKYCDYGNRFLTFDFPKAGSILMGTLFAHRIRFGEKKELTAITLPENFFIAVCGITIGEEDDV